MSRLSGSRGHGVRSIVTGRSATQRLGIFAVLAVLATAPFGGLDKAHTDDSAALRIGTRYDIGPFYVSIEKVETLGDLAPAVSPMKGDRLFVIEVTVENHTGRAEPVSLATNALGGHGTGVVPWQYESDIRLKAFDVADGSSVDAEEINPGQKYEIAYVAQQGPDWHAGHVVLSLSGYDFETDDPTGLDPDVWILTKTLAEGPVTVEVKP